MVEFSSPIFKTGINPVVDPPDDVLEVIFKQAGKSKGPIPVCGKLNGADALDRNIDRLLKHLRGENVETLHALMRKEKPRK